MSQGKFTKAQSSVDSVKEFWGEDAPEWVMVLAEFCDASSQVQVAKQIGYSSPVVNAIIKNAYTGRVALIEKAVRGRFMAQTVNCPVLGELGADICLWHQKRAIKDAPATSAMRSSVARACRSGECPHSKVAAEGDS